MKILMINVVCGIESTGRICTDLAEILENQGHQVKIAYGRGLVPEKYKKYAVKIGTNVDVFAHALRARMLDDMGFGSYCATKKFIKWVEEFNPDIIHLHNIHGYYINVKVLFDYLKAANKKIIWTLHDCWSFTGHCAYFDYVQCDKWKTECNNCPQKSEYPARILCDKSKKHYFEKKSLFTGLKDLVLVTPSKWLAELVKQSYLQEYRVFTIYNGINTSVFKPVDSDIKKKLGIENKKIVLGVASVWDRRKGLDAFYKLSEKLSDDYKIVLVGLSKKQIGNLPRNIIGIERTDCVEDLVKLYSASYVFVNPTLEDNYPTTNLEAIACETPVITYNTGGSGESAKMYGYVVKKNDLNGIISLINQLDIMKKENVIIDSMQTFKEYIDLYLKMAEVECEK